MVDVCSEKDIILQSVVAEKIIEDQPQQEE